MSTNKKNDLKKSENLKSGQEELTKIKKPLFKEKFINDCKLLIKDLKRTRWVSANEIKHSFVRIVFFIVIISLVLFGIAYGFSTLWNTLGVGING